MSVSETSTTTRTHCVTHIACSTEDTVTTSTVTSEPHEYPTFTISQIDYLAPTGDADNAALLSLADSISSEHIAWDASRYGGLTVAPSVSTSTVLIGKFFSMHI